MAIFGTFCANWTRFQDHITARRVAWARPETKLTSSPEPRSIGSFARGRQLSRGTFRFAGHVIRQPGLALWDLVPPSAAFAAELHGFGWLDDLAATGDAPARTCAQDWCHQWIARYGNGRGPGWVPELTGRRLIRWINHAPFLLTGQESATAERFFRSLGQQTLFLGRRWHASAPGLPRFEALCGLIHASAALSGQERHTGPAVAALARECASHIDSTGAIASRNPEELLDLLTLLTWSIAVLEQAGHAPVPALDAVAQRIAPTLRLLRHADGDLARFHDGGRGPEGRLDAALAACKARNHRPEGLAMGYARLSAGRVSLIIDAAPPPAGAASGGAHASAMAFEMTSARRKVVINCGSGASFGADWHRAGRASAAHSTLVIAGESSAQLSAASGTGAEWLVNAASNMPVRMSRASDGLRFEGGHDGYVARFGLTHARTIEMTFDGRGIAGEDKLLALDPADKRRFDKAMIARAMQGVPYQVHFHLHPEVDARLDMGGAVVSLALRSGEIWLFRTDMRGAITLEPSVYLEKSRLEPRASKQIVLSGRALEYASRIRWSLAKTQDTPIGIRDLAPAFSFPPQGG